MRAGFGQALLLACVLLAGALLAHPAPVSAQVNGRHAAIVADANNGAVLHADQADESRYPASLTKIMTLYLAFEAIEQGRASYATRIKISHEAASQPPTKLDLDPGETIALIDAMKALITKSANDAAVAIAEHFGGTEARFAQMMTDKARRFGMSRTTFRNASGLPDPGQVTTARDMLRLALRIQDDFPKHYTLFSTRSFSYDGSHYRNHNNLLFRFQGTDGIKTGYTRASGFNLVSSVRRGGRHVIGVVLGGRTAGRRDDAMQLLVSRALVQASPYKTRKTAPVLVALAKPAQRPQPGVQPAPAQSPPPAPPVAEVARPRPVMVPPRPRTPERESIAAPAPSPPVLVSPPAVAVRPVRPAPPRAADEPAPRYAFVPRGTQERVSDAHSPAQAAAVPVRGTPPSTFQQQAANLTRGAEPPPQNARPVPKRPLDPPYAVRGPVQPAAASGFEIQIGAYGTAAEADRAIAAARTSASDLLQAHNGRAVLFNKENRQIYRARFTGFDSRGAASTCLELRRRQVDCFVMRAE